MRSFQVYRALGLVPNRYTLCQTISQSARRIHVNGDPFQSTVTAILTGIGDGSFTCQTQAGLHRDDCNATSHDALLVN